MPSLSIIRRRRLKVSVVNCRECGVYSESVRTHTWWSPDMVGTSDKPLFILHNYILNTNHRCLAMETCLAMQTCFGGIFWSGILTDLGERCSLKTLERRTDDRYQLRPVFSFRSVLQSITTDADIKICTQGQNLILLNYFLASVLRKCTFPKYFTGYDMVFCMHFCPKKYTVHLAFIALFEMPPVTLLFTFVYRKLCFTSSTS